MRCPDGSLARCPNCGKANICRVERYHFGGPMYEFLSCHRKYKKIEEICGGR